MKVVIAPDGFGGTLAPEEVASAIARGWGRERPGDHLVMVPLSDGGEGLLGAVARPDDRWMSTEVAGPLGHPIDAAWLLRDGGVAVIESARACGLALVPASRRSPMLTTTYGVGQLIDAAREAGARRILIGLGGSATVDGGAGALLGLGFRLSVEDGSGLKIGGDDLHRVRHAELGWSAAFDEVDIVLLSDVTTRLDAASAVFGPQKGADPRDVERLAEGLERWADVAEVDLADGVRHRETPGSGAAGGLGFGLACALGASYEPGAAHVGDLVGLGTALNDADLVITGEGRLDATSTAGKVVGAVLAAVQDKGIAVAGVVGKCGDGAPQLELLEEASPGGPGAAPARDVESAAARLAARWL